MTAHMIEHELTMDAIRQSDRIARLERERRLNFTDQGEKTESKTNVSFLRRFSSQFGGNRTFRPATNGVVRP